MKILRIFATLLASVSLAGGGLHAQSLDQAINNADSELEQLQTRYSELQSTIAEEKRPLVVEVNNLEDDVLDKTREVRDLQRAVEGRKFELDRLRKEVADREDELEYVQSLLNEFVRNFQSQVHISETAQYEEATTQARLAMENEALSEAEQVTASLDVVAMALDRMEDIIGGKTFEGKSLTPSAGELEAGSFGMLGPVVYFASDASGAAGIVEMQGDTAMPTVFEVGGEYHAGIKNFTTTGTGVVPLDPTQGKALKIEVSRDTIWEHIQKGQIVGYAIIVLGLLAGTVGLFKIFEINRFRSPGQKEINSILEDLQNGDKAKAEADAKKVGGAGGDLMLMGVRHYDEKRRVLEELLYEKLLRVRPTLERFLPFLAVTAAAAPLMGLLGTVMGMIKTFKYITIFGTGDAKNLSEGISEALVTTELGLIVAIPMLIFHGYLTRLARGKINRMEQAAIAFLNGVTMREEKSPIAQDKARVEAE